VFDSLSVVYSATNTTDWLSHTICSTTCKDSLFVTRCTSYFSLCYITIICHIEVTTPALRGLQVTVTTGQLHIPLYLGATINPTLHMHSSWYCVFKQPSI